MHTALSPHWQHATQLALACAFVILCLFPASAARATSPYERYTTKQKAHTRTFLQAFVHANPLLDPLPAEDFCSWAYLACKIQNAVLYLDATSAAGTLPELPSNVTGRYVILSEINVRYGGYNLIGTLPASWGTLTNLEYLSLFSNSLSGTLPPEWSGMKALSWVFLYDNQLSGTMPDAWAKLNYLSWVSVRKNALTGTLPSSWSAAPSLATLEADDNELSGTLPSSWSAVSTLRGFTLTNNSLSGSLPDSWGSLPQLTSALLKGNRFCGCIPESWKNRESSLKLTVDAAVAAANCATANRCPA